MPALPLDKAGPYVAAAYLAFLTFVLVYVMIMAMKLRRIEREVTDLTQIVEHRAKASSTQIESERVLEEALS